VRIFTLYATEFSDEGYSLDLDIAEGIPADIVKKVAKELAIMVDSISEEDFPVDPGDAYTVDVD